jgi:glucose-1-phosphate thymidylyltransferase
VGKDSVALALGDNIFFGHGLHDVMNRAAAATGKGRASSSAITSPTRSATASSSSTTRARRSPSSRSRSSRRSNWAVIGLYFYDNSGHRRRPQPEALAARRARDHRRQPIYLERGELAVERRSRGYAWLDTGTHDSLLQSGEFVRTIQQRTGLQIACLEEIGWRNGWISQADLLRRADALAKNPYGLYLRQVAEEH